MALLSRAIKKGVNLQTHTPVKRVSDVRDSSGRWTIQTERGSTKARWVVFATNAYTSAILPQYKDKIVPVRGICSRIVCDKPAPLLQCTYSLRWNKWDYDYLIPRTDGSIVVGGARSAFIRDRDSWYDVVDDSKLIDSAASYFDGYMQRHFKGWEESGARTDKVWTGSMFPLFEFYVISKFVLVMGYSTDSLPHVGGIPDRPGQLIVAGFTGHGMPNAFLSAEGIAQMIVKGAAFEETSLPKLYKTSQARLDRKVNKIFATLTDVVAAPAKL